MTGNKGFFGKLFSRGRPQEELSADECRARLFRLNNKLDEENDKLRKAEKELEELKTEAVRLKTGGAGSASGNARYELVKTRAEGVMATITSHTGSVSLLMREIRNLSDYATAKGMKQIVDLIGQSRLPDTETLWDELDQAVIAREALVEGQKSVRSLLDEALKDATAETGGREKTEFDRLVDREVAAMNNIADITGERPAATEAGPETETSGPQNGKKGPEEDKAEPAAQADPDRGK